MAKHAPFCNTKPRSECDGQCWDKCACTAQGGAPYTSGCPIHDTYTAQQRPSKPDPSPECLNDNHASGCKCHQGEPITLDPTLVCTCAYAGDKPYLHRGTCPAYDPTSDPRLTATTCLCTPEHLHVKCPIHGDIAHRHPDYLVTHDPALDHILALAEMPDCTCPGGGPIAGGTIEHLINWDSFCPQHGSRTGMRTPACVLESPTPSCERPREAWWDLHTNTPTASEPEPSRARAGQLLEDAAKTIGAGGDRHTDYGSAIDNFTAIGKLWAVVLGVEVTAEQVALCMNQVKVSRLLHTPNHRDSWVDGIGYLALGGDIAGTPGRHTP